MTQDAIRTLSSIFLDVKGDHAHVVKNFLYKQGATLGKIDPENLRMIVDGINDQVHRGVPVADAFSKAMAGYKNLDTSAMSGVLRSGPANASAAGKMDALDRAASGLADPTPQKNVGSAPSAGPRHDPVPTGTSHVEKLSTGHKVFAGVSLVGAALNTFGAYSSLKKAFSGDNPDGKIDTSQAAMGLLQLGMAAGLAYVGVQTARGVDVFR